ncbi:MAG: GerMN domain-containing protein [Firmicutes bacterium]|nr:GerMN domain-containing protein [Bacillota bacterium]
MKNYVKTTMIALILIISFMVTGCGSKMVTDEGKPIEPLVLGAEEGKTPAVGQFNVKSSDVQITDLAITADGSLTVVGTESRVVYLLAREGKPLWEKQYSAVPLKTYIAADGSYIAVGTADGKLLLLNSDQSEKARHQFEGAISQMTASLDGDLLLVGLHSEEDGKEDRLVAIEKMSTVLWQKELGTIVDIKVAGVDNRVIVNWLEGDIPVLGAFSATGEPLWELRQRSQLGLDNSGQMMITTHGEEIYRYNKDAREIWGFPTAGEISRVLMAENGLYVAAIITDEATQHQELLYLSMDGTKLWNMPLPDDADVIVSADGSRVIVSSWGQFQDDVTQIFVYNQKGQELNVLDVAGRAQKMAFASQTETLVLGLIDGNIYFLNIAEKMLSTEPVFFSRQLTDYYNPVVFGRSEGESYVTLYFYDNAAQYLLPVTRSVKSSQPLLREGIQELIRGPAQGSELMRTIPKDAKINVDATDGVVNLDLPLSLDQKAGSTFLRGVLDSLLLTVSSMSTVEEIRFTVAGKEQETFGQEGIVINEPFQPQPFGKRDGERLLFLPAMSAGKYYLRPVSEEFVSLKDNALAETVVRVVLAQFADSFERAPSLQSVRIEKNIVYVDFTSSLNNIIVNSPDAAARVAMLRDALALSIVENLPYATVKITSNGKTPKRADNYLPWEVTITRPYYINMEK